jgi:L-rhamnose isomerase
MLRAIRAEQAAQREKLDADYASLSVRLDNLDRRIDRIEQRLELVEVPGSS